MHLQFARPIAQGRPCRRCLDQRARIEQGGANVPPCSWWPIERRRDRAATDMERIR